MLCETNSSTITEFSCAMLTSVIYFYCELLIILANENVLSVNFCVNSTRSVLQENFRLKFWPNKLFFNSIIASGRR